MSGRLPLLSLLLLFTLPAPLFASDLSPEANPRSDSDTGPREERATTAGVPEVVVSAERIEETATLPTITLDLRELEPMAAATSDAVQLIDDLPGVDLHRGGGVSGLPVLRGLADDRIRTNIDGRELPSACGNHMNPPLSYIDPAQISRIQVTPGITPVSSGGDSIGGTISVQSPGPEFAKPGSKTLARGQVSSFTRSNGQNHGGNLGATLAGEKVSLALQASTSRAKDYTDGNDRTVKSTAFEADNHAARVALRNDGHLLTLDLGGQDLPYQDFVNAHMDMIGNQASFANGRYEGAFAWGRLDAQLHWQNTTHQMNVRGDKMPGMNMPMNTEGTTTGYLVKAEIPLSEQDTLKVGHEFVHFGLDDWWPPSPAQAASACNTGDVNSATCSMAPGTLWNINDGRRSRVGSFVEWNSQWDPRWSSLLGIRNDLVLMDTDAVVGYNMNPVAAGSAAYLADAIAFNARERDRQDLNFDLTALLTFEPDPTHAIEGGYARKTRSPSLYERYLWIFRSSMSSRMNSAVGDANGYSGNLDLKPEVAHTLSLTFDRHDPERTTWAFRVTPYYTFVDDFIDADRCSPLTGGNGCTTQNVAATSGLVNLQYANHDAELYGVDLSGRRSIARETIAGDFALSATLAFTRGVNRDTGDNLYHIMPLNTQLAL
ncbi:MAG: TonB-dependent receptor, partial [Magnetococcales bacterium]|nr:TonB-dependent receptor [Magnetococcales bacterium]